MCRYIRHPGYLGWYVWAVGTQVLLVNPICIVLFSVLVSRPLTCSALTPLAVRATLFFHTQAWRFFNMRIRYEEWHLRRFFPAYDGYAAATPTWIPWIK